MLIILDPTPLNPNLSRFNCKLVNNSYNDHLDKNGSRKPDLGVDRILNIE